MQNFEFEINTKATQKLQSNNEMTSVSTQTVLDPNKTCEVIIQCNIERIQCNIEQPQTDGNENLEIESDDEATEEREYNASDQSKAEYSSCNESTSVSAHS